MNNYFAYSHEMGVEFFPSAELAKERAERELCEYRECAAGEGWSEDTESVCWGKVTEFCKIVSEEEVTEEDPWFGEFDRVLDYGLVKTND